MIEIGAPAIMGNTAYSCEEYSYNCAEYRYSRGGNQTYWYKIFFSSYKKQETCTYERINNIVRTV